MSAFESVMMIEKKYSAVQMGTNANDEKPNTHRNDQLSREMVDAG